MFALKYTYYLTSTAIDVYTSSIGVFTDRSALYKPKKLVKWSKTLINYHFIAISIPHVRFHMFGFSANNKKDQDIQFVDNYPDNRVSVPALIFISFLVIHVAIDFSLVQKEVSQILKDRILIGHSIHNDLKVLN